MAFTYNVTLRKLMPAGNYVGQNVEHSPVEDSGYGGGQ